MGAALYDGSGGHQRELRLVLELGNGERTTVAHGALQLQQGDGHVVLQAAGVGHVRIDALFEGQRLLAAQIVAAPVAGAGTPLAPVLLHVGAVHHDLGRRALVEAGEVAAQHDEVGAHGQCERNVMIVHDAAVGADGHVDAGLAEVLVAGLRHFNGRGGLAAADALGLAGDADGTAADADLHKVGARVGEEAEALGVNHVARADLHVVAVVLAHPFDGHLLPVGIALGAIDAQHVGAGLDKRRHTLGVVAGVDARAHHVALVGVQKLVGIGLVGVVVLAEHERHQMVLGVHDGQRVQLVIPDDVVGGLQRGAIRSHHELLARRHEVGHLLVHGHAGEAVVALGHDAEQLTVGASVIGDGHGGMPVLLLQSHYLLERHVGGEVCVGGDEAGLVVLHAGHHGGLVLDGLVAVDERQTALGGERHGHLVVGHGGHDGGNHRHGKRERALLLALAVLHQRGLQADARRNAIGRRMARNQQVLVECAGRFIEIVGHGCAPSSTRCPNGDGRPSVPRRPSVSTHAPRNE